MSKVGAFISVTLDGVMQAPGLRDTRNSTTGVIIATYDVATAKPA